MECANLIVLGEQVPQGPQLESESKWRIQIPKVTIYTPCIIIIIIHALYIAVIIIVHNYNIRISLSKPTLEIVEFTCAR